MQGVHAVYEAFESRETKEFWSGGGMSEKTLIVIYDNDRIHYYKPDDADYWIRRRMEKEGIEPQEAWIGEKFDFQPIVDAFYKEQAEYDAQAAENRDRREYERLKAKYEREEK